VLDRTWPKMSTVRHSPSVFRRFVHWGPILSIGKCWKTFIRRFFVLIHLERVSVIYKFVTLTTLYFTEMWWPCFGSLGGFLNNALLLTLFVVSFSCYLKSVIVGPGFLPPKWKPVCGQQRSFDSHVKTKWICVCV